MKKYLVFGMMSALALAFTACSSEEDINPTYDGNTVKTQFTISLPDNVAGTRMATGATQETQLLADFLGIKDIKLLPFTAEPTATSTTNGSVVTLADIATDGLESGCQAKVYNDVAINTGTKYFLFYGKANKTDGFEYGKLTKTEYSSAVGDITFSPVAICTSTEACGGSSIGTGLIAALNGVAGVSGWSSTTNVKLAQLYNAFITLTAGSSLTVQATLEDLYNALSAIASATGVTQAEKDLATAIQTKIKDYGTATTATPAVFTLNSGLKGYPADINLPDGAARVLWNTTAKKFEDNCSANNAALASLNIPNLNAYTYPASLQYFVSSPLKAANEKMTDATGKYGKNLWNGTGGNSVIEAYTAKSATNVVTALTRSIAIENQIQYGVGCLKTSVAALPATLKDSKDETVTTTNGYTLTGLLIGGQKPVNWDFTTSTLGDAPVTTIYDKTMQTIKTVTTPVWTVKTSAASSALYTLALETVKDETVYVALEFTNNGADFNGASGIIPAGGKFYLVGELSPTDVVGYDDTEKGKDRVFTQDYITTATFTITSLAGATNVIPDLRAPQVELGLSVDLTWKPGLTFEVDL